MNEEIFRDELFADLPQQAEDAGQPAEDVGTEAAATEATAPATETAAPETAEAGADAGVENANPAVPPVPASEEPAPAPAAGQPAVDTAKLVELFMQLQNENNQLKAAIQQQSQVKEETIVESLQPPSLDYDKLMYADDVARKAAEADYAGKLGEYIRTTTLKDMEPMLNEYRESKERKSYSDAISGLRGVPDVNDKFGGSLDGALDVISKIPALKQLKPEEAVITAALIAKGKEALNTAKRTPEQIAEEASASPEVMKLLELKRVASAKGGAKPPPMAASHGSLDAAALNLPKKPESFDEAFAELTKILGNG